MAYYKQEMLKNSVIIIPNVSSEVQVCDFLLQTAKILAKDNLVFVPTFSVGSRNYQYQGIFFLKYYEVLPFKRFLIVNKLNRLIYFFLLQIYLNLKYLSYKKRYLWIFFPGFSDLLKVKLSSFKTIFDIVDFHFSSLPSKQAEITNQKKYLLKNSDYVFSISKTLKNLYQKDCASDIKIVPQGFALEDFVLKSKKSKLSLPKNKPVIGFIGQISQRLDLKLLNYLIKNNQQWNFVFIGPKHHESNVAIAFDDKQINKIFNYSNVFYYEGQPKNTILSIVKQFDICMIPYNVKQPFNLYSYPMKTFEYFYAGKPIVSTPIKELKNFTGLIKISDSPSEWEIELGKIIKNSWPLKNIKKQHQLALDNSWKSKLENISRYL